MVYDFTRIKEFLKREDSQKFLSDNDLESLYTSWSIDVGGTNRYLTAFFLQINIDPLQYMTYTVEGMFKGLAFAEMDLSGTNIEQLDRYTFEDCFTLRDINLGNVKYIGVGAFSGCSSLRSITFPPSLDSIDEKGFEYTCLEEVHIPKTVRRIGFQAFQHNGYLHKVTTDHTKEEFINVCCGDSDMKNTFSCCESLDKIICSDGELTV